MTLLLILCFQKGMRPGFTSQSDKLQGKDVCFRRGTVYHTRAPSCYNLQKKGDEDMATESQNKKSGDDNLTEEAIVAAFEKLFGAGARGVRRFAHSGLRHVKLPEGAVLIEQNLEKKSEWAELARNGHRVAWAMRDGEYLARVIDGEVEMLKRS
jgi:hypothetical protein